MIRLMKKIYILSLLTVLLVSCQQTDTQDSPLLHEAKFLDAYNKWGESAFLPTYLPQYYYLADARVDHHDFGVYMDIVHINQVKTMNKKLTSLKHGEPDTIKEILDRVKDRKIKPDIGIQEIEPIRIQSSDGYWYLIRDTKGSYQVVEYIQDNLHVILRTEKLSKEEFLKIVYSMKRFEKTTTAS
jgi:hypothetical protein